MTSQTVSRLVRGAALAGIAVLGLTACGSDDAETPPTPETSSPSDLEIPEAPEETEQEVALAESLEADFEVTTTATLQEQWPDLTAMASALSGTENPDQCQQAGATQYELLVDAQPASVQATIEPDAVLDEEASGETVTVFYANDDVTTERLHEVHQDTDAQCVEENESAIDHEVSQAQAADTEVDVHTWQVVASDQLTGRMIDVVGEEIFVRYAAAYPPQVLVEELEDDVAEEFNTAATERALEVFEVAASQAASEVAAE